MADKCPFCEPDPDRVWLRTETAIVLWDAFPIAKGHTLVVPKPHVASIYFLFTARRLRRAISKRRVRYR